MKKRLITILIVLFFALQIIACRFTVREIGFSTLSRDLYSLVLIDQRADPNDLAFSKIRDRLTESNIGLMVLDPVIDKTHPALLAAKEAGIQLPATILMSPDGRIWHFEEIGLKEIVNEILNSPLSLQIIRNSYNSFAFTVLIESTNTSQNIQAEEMLEQGCQNITNRIPNMPKQVKKGATLLKIKSSDFAKERILLWSLGINQIPENPMAFVIYGRGRIIGEVIDYNAIVSNLAFTYMAMIGADCECGLDRNWMLGNQVPIDWPSATRQQLADELGFDVDNPMILAEMSQILAKDPVSDLSLGITFAPEEFDLDSFFSQSKEDEDHEAVDHNPGTLNPLMIILFASVIVLLLGGILFIRRKK